MKPFFCLFFIWLKMLLRRWSYITFLLVSIAIFYMFKDLMFILTLIPQELLVTNMMILTGLVGWIYSLAHDPRKLLGIGALPASDWRIDVMNLITFLPFPLVLSMFSPIPSLYYIALSAFLFLGIVGSPLLLLIGLALAYYFNFLVSIVFGIVLLTKMSLKLIPNRRVTLLWMGKNPVTIINPLILWPLSLVILGMLLIHANVHDTELWVSPIGGGATYLSNISLSEEGCVLLLGGVFTALYMLLSLMLPLSVSALRYLDNYIWHIKLLRGLLNRSFILEVLSNTVFGIIVIALPFLIFMFFGIGSLEGVLLVLTLSLFLSSALAPSPDRNESLGNFLLGYVLLGFIIGRIQAPEGYVVMLAVSMLFPAYLIWFKLKKEGRI